VPKFTRFVPRLTDGWQTNALYTFSGGTPISPSLNTDNTHTDQFKDRPNVVLGVNPYLGRKVLTASNGSRTYQYLTNTAFSAPPLGVYGDETAAVAGFRANAILQNICRTNPAKKAR
jgi:hypothetical protein